MGGGGPSFSLARVSTASFRVPAAEGPPSPDCLCSASTSFTRFPAGGCLHEMFRFLASRMVRCLSSWWPEPGLPGSCFPDGQLLAAGSHIDQNHKVVVPSTGPSAGQTPRDDHKQQTETTLWPAVLRFIGAMGRQVWNSLVDQPQRALQMRLAAQPWGQTQEHSAQGLLFHCRGAGAFRRRSLGTGNGLRSCLLFPASVLLHVGWLSGWFRSWLCSGIQLRLWSAHSRWCRGSPRFRSPPKDRSIGICWAHRGV